MDKLLLNIIEDITFSIPTADKDLQDKYIEYIEHFPQNVLKFYLLFKEIFEQNTFETPYKVFSSGNMLSEDYYGLVLLCRDKGIDINKILYSNKAFSDMNIIINSEPLKVLKKLTSNRLMVASFNPAKCEKIIKLLSYKYTPVYIKNTIILNEQDLIKFYLSFELPESLLKLLETYAKRKLNVIYFEKSITFQIALLSINTVKTI